MCVKYDHSDFLQIRHKVQSSETSKSLDTIKFIRKHRLNKRGKRAGKNCNKQKYLDTNTSGSEHETSIYNKPEQGSRDNISILLIHAQSIKNKDILLAEYIHDINIDVCVVTETWLDKNSDEVNAWISTCELTKHGYCLDAISRETRGGGLAIIYKREYRVKKTL